MTTATDIINQMPSFLSFAADGTQVLNKEGLREWVRAQMTTALGTSGLIGQIDGELNPAIDRLAATLSVDHWSRRSDWPLGSVSALKEASGSRASTVSDALVKLRSAARQVSTSYSGVNSKMKIRIAEVVTFLFAAPEGAGGLSTPTTRMVDSRFYVCTLVTDWGEESAPSPPSDLVVTDQNDTVTVTRVGALPTDRGTIASWRLYRSNSGSSAAAFQFVADIPIATASYVDSKVSSELGEVLTTTYWDLPPSNLQGMTGMSNGVMAGYFDRTLCFCEPYAPYAWPVKYQLSVKYPIVGLGFFGQALFVGTRSAPYLVMGTDSASMSVTELASGQACVSARSIVAVENGVIYASPDGLCLAGPSGVEVLTGALFSREDWQALKPDSIIAVLHDSIYYFLWSSGANSGCYALDFVARKLVEVEASGSALYSDSLTDTLFVASGTSIIAPFDTGRRAGKYRTGIANIGAHQPFSWLQVDSDFSAPVTVKWYGDGSLRHTATVNSIAPVRLPAGRWLEHEIEVESEARITSVLLAGSTDELKRV